MVSRARTVLVATVWLAAALTTIARADDERSDTERRAAADRVCAAHDPSCNWLATFSTLEQGSMRRALAARGLTLEPMPWGKRIRHVHVVNEDVFAEDNFLRWLNFIHYTTRERAILDELTIGEGELWDQERVEESARRLRDPLYSSVVALVPVGTGRDDEVDLLVVTRDVWSLRFNSQYTFQQLSLTNLTISISENNFLGHRNLLSAGIVMDQGAIAVGPLFIDKNFLGSHFDLRVRVDDVLTRRAPRIFDPSALAFVPVPGDATGVQDASRFHSEGHDATIQLTRPLWSLATEWGGGVIYSFRNAINRAYSGASPVGFPSVQGDPYALYLDPTTNLPWEYRLRTWSFNPYVVRQWGDTIKHQLSFGYSLTSQRPELLPSFIADAALIPQFEADVFPRSELLSQPYVEYVAFIPRYRTLRNVSTYDLAEDTRIGPDVDISYGQGLKILGSDYNFEKPAAAIGWTIPWCRDGFVRPSLGISLRYQAPSGTHPWDSIDNTANAQVHAASPTYGLFRIVAQASVYTRWHDTQNAMFVIGSDTGLRGYGVNEFITLGSGRLVNAQVELRTVPVPWWVLRLGAVAFYEAGGTAPSLREMTLFHDVGAGVRLLIPQTSRELFRFDVALPIVAAQGNPAWSPHFIAGFQSYF